MKKIFLAIVIFITVNNFAFSQEEIPKIISATEIREQDTVKEKDNMKFAIYLHPVSLIMPALNTGHFVPPMFYYLTIEKPLNLSNSLIIKPSLLLNNVSNDSVFRVGSDIGFRHHWGKKYDPWGWGKETDCEKYYLQRYIQGQCGIFYMSETKDDNTEGYVYSDIMFYIGMSVKTGKRIIWFYDFGIGMASRTNLGIYNTNFLIDFNIGIGLRF